MAEAERQSNITPNRNVLIINLIYVGLFRKFTIFHENSTLPNIVFPPTLPHVDKISYFYASLITQTK